MMVIGRLGALFNQLNSSKLLTCVVRQKKAELVVFQVAISLVVGYESLLANDVLPDIHRNQRSH